jgi:hypothetical protein
MGFGEIRGLAGDDLGTQNAGTQDSNAQSTNVLTPSAVEPLLDLFVKKGFVTQDEANQVRAEAEAEQTNNQSFLQSSLSKWKISDGTRNLELFGDVRARYEDRSAKDPNSDQVGLQRERYSVRLGLRGDLFDNFYYGLRLETGSNPRSTFITAGGSSPGPYGKSAASFNIGQAYIGWRQGNWLDITLGKMPNPLYTSTLVWNANISPEGVAERFKYTVGEADLFANFGQFVYQDFNPNTAPQGFLGLNTFAQNVPNIYQIAWQGGLTYHVTDNLSAKVAATIYSYQGLQPSTVNSGSNTSPYYSDAYVGEGAYAGPNYVSSGLLNGWNGYGNNNIVTTGGYGSLGYYNNQVGINNLLVLEVPFEVNYKIDRVVLRAFGDVAYNLEGKQRAEAAAAGYSAYLAAVPQTIGGGSTAPTISGFSPQTSQVKAYQIGFGIGSTNVDYGQTQGLVYGTGSAKNAWEIRAYWQHIEQYSLDPNLLDTDFFNGLENMQGFYVAFAYGFSANVIGTIRYGRATRIDKLIGTGGSSSDIPQINPVDSYSIFQVDMTLKF